MPKPKRTRNPARDAEMLRLAQKEGWTLRRIAQAHGVSAARVSKILGRQDGLDWRDRRRPSGEEALFLKVLKDPSVSIREAARGTGIHYSRARRIVTRDRLRRGLSAHRPSPHLRARDPKAHPKLPLLERMVLQEGRSLTEAARALSISLPYAWTIAKAAHGLRWSPLRKRADAIARIRRSLDALSGPHHRADPESLRRQLSRMEPQELEGLAAHAKTLHSALRHLAEVPDPTNPRKESAP